MLLILRKELNLFMQFNTEQLNNIPIAEVAKLLGIDITRKKVVMCFKGHGKKTPSLSFDLNRNFYNCFSCQIAGGPIKLVMDYYECDFKVASHWLSERFLHSNYASYQLKRPQYKPVETIENLFQADSEIYEWLIANTTLSQKAIEYFQSRGITESTLRTFHIKDIESPSIILQKAVEKWGMERFLKCGLGTLQNGVYNPIWRSYVILFPFFNIYDRITYIQGRSLNSDPKFRWMNLKGVSSCMFNERVLKNLEVSDIIIITEGLTDALSLYQMGKNAIGIMGASNFKDEYAEKLKDFEILVVPDNDAAGELFFKRVEKSFEKYKSIRRVILPKQYKDVNDAMKGKDIG